MGILDVRTLKSAMWQEAINGLGNVVTDLDDISQAIQILLTTPPGSDPLRPDFAFDLYSFIDAPINHVKGAMVSGALAAIRRWEPRAEVTRIEVLIPEMHSLVMRVFWVPTFGGDAQVTDVNALSTFTNPEAYWDTDYADSSYVA